MRTQAPTTLVSLLLSAALAGCATTTAPAGLPGVGAAPPAAPEAPKDAPAVAALLRLADLPLLRLATTDADATLAWVQAREAALGPLKAFRARQCPEAVKLAAGDVRTKVLALAERLRALDRALAEPTPGPQVILAATRLKFGEGPDPQEAIGRLRDDVGNRLAAVTLSCAGLLPVEQIRDAAALAARAGLITTPLGPLGGLIP